MDRKETRILFVIFLLLFSACRYAPFELSKQDQNPLERNDDNQLFVTGSIHRYEVTYLDSQQVERSFFMPDTKLAFDAPYPVLEEASYGEHIHEVKFVELLIEPATVSNLSNEGQTTVYYSYYDRNGKKLPFGSRTGVVDNAFNIWMHPPRTSGFKILNLCAYPYVKLPLKKGQKWEYEILIGKKWGHKDFGNWRENSMTFTHSYEVIGETTLSLHESGWLCQEIIANTASDLGQNKSRFYYHNQHGFVMMEFFNLNGSVIRFEKVI